MSRRKVLQDAVAGTLLELGFDSAEQLALETLTEILQSYISEIGASSRAYCELAGRTEPLFADVLMALVNMGSKINEIEQFTKRDNRCIIPTPLQTTQPKQLNILQAGVKQPHPQHIPTHLPQFPDPHAYIRTPTHKQPVTEYEAIREKAAAQKRDTERALNKFIAKTGETDSLFTVQDIIFPLIACKPTFLPYLNALLPKDQVFEFEDEYASPQRKKNKGEIKEVEEEEEEEGQAKGDLESIDNPYLRPVKVPIKIKIKDLLNHKMVGNAIATGPASEQ